MYVTPLNLNGKIHFFPTDAPPTVLHSLVAASVMIGSVALKVVVSVGSE